MLSVGRPQLIEPPIPREFRAEVTLAAARVRSAIDHYVDSVIIEIAETLVELRSQSESFTANAMLEPLMVNRVTGYIAAAQQSLSRVPTASDPRERIKMLNKAYNSLDHLSGMLGILFSLWYPDGGS